MSDNPQTLVANDGDKGSQRFRELQAPTPAMYKSRSAPNPQIESLFLRRLPVEIRLVIYGEFIRSWGWIGGVHLVRMTMPTAPGPKLTAYPCDGETVSHTHLKEIGFDQTWSLWGCFCQGRTYSETENPIALFLSCRQIHNEAIHLLYSSFTFDLRGLDTAIWFFATVPKEQVDRITEIKVSAISARDTRVGDNIDATEYHRRTSGYEWRSLCQHLAEMKALRRLAFHMPVVCLRENFSGGMMAWLVAIKQVPKASFFVVVHLFTEETLEFVDTDQVPFVVKRVTRWDYPDMMNFGLHDTVDDGMGIPRAGTPLWIRVLLLPDVLLFVSCQLVIRGFKWLRNKWQRRPPAFLRRA